MSTLPISRSFAARCAKQVSRGLYGHRCWSATAHVGTDDWSREGDARPAASGKDVQPNVSQSLVSDSHQKDMDAFREFRAVARGFRWPNHGTLTYDENSPDGEVEVEVDSIVGGAKTVGGFDASFSDMVHDHNDTLEAAGRETSEVENAYTDDDLFGDDGERMSFDDLMALAEVGPDGNDGGSSAASLKGRRTFGRVIRKEISERDVLTLSMFVNELGRIQPRHVTGLSPKQQRKVAKMVKRARHMGVMPHMFRLPPQFAFTSPLHNMTDIERVEAWNDARPSN